ncbi:MAG: hypothetical protein ACRD3T_07960 [Terriglobia bacterium]
MHRRLTLPSIAAFGGMTIQEQGGQESPNGVTTCRDFDLTRCQILVNMLNPSLFNLPPRRGIAARLKFHRDRWPIARIYNSGVNTAKRFDSPF